MKLRTSLTAACFSILLASNAAAQPTDVAAAEALFQTGQRLLKEGKIDEACDSLGESHRIDPGVGTLLLLADCRERQGRLATAWAMFHEAIPPSRSGGNKTREELATKRAAALEPRLPKMTIRVLGAVVGLEVRRNEQKVGAGTYGVALPVDPGEHTIVVSAPGFQSWSTRVKLREAELLTVDVPLLSRAPQPEAQRSALSAQPDERAAQTPVSGEKAAPLGGEWPALRTAGIVVGAIGVVGVGIGTAFGIKSAGEWSDARDQCTEGGGVLHCPNEAGLTNAESSQSSATVANIGVFAGAGLVATGIALIVVGEVTSTRPAPSAWLPLPTAAPNEVGVIWHLAL